MSQFTTFLKNVDDVIINPLILLAFALATLYFFYGIVNFSIQIRERKTKSKQEVRYCGELSVWLSCFQYMVLSGLCWVHLVLTKRLWLVAMSLARVSTWLSRMVHRILVHLQIDTTGSKIKILAPRGCFCLKICTKKGRESLVGYRGLVKEHLNLVFTRESNLDWLVGRWSKSYKLNIVSEMSWFFRSIG